MHRKERAFGFIIEAWLVNQLCLRSREDDEIGKIMSGKLQKSSLFYCSAVAGVEKRRKPVCRCRTTVFVPDFAPFFVGYSEKVA